MFKIIVGFFLFAAMPLMGQQTPEAIRADAENLVDAQVSLYASCIGLTNKVKDGGIIELVIACSDGKGASAGAMKATALKSELPKILEKYGTKEVTQNGQIQSKSISGILRMDRFGSLYLDLTKTSF